MTAATIVRDTSDLDAAPAIVREAAENRHAWRLYLVTTYPSGSQWHRTGYIGRTTGTRPAFLLMNDSRAIGSSDLLDARTWENTAVVGVQRGARWGYFSPVGTRARVMPGRNRYTEPVTP